MASNNALTLQGSNLSSSSYGGLLKPADNSYGGLFNSGSSSTPYGKALNPVKTPVLPAQVTPTTPVKSTKVTHPNGTIIETTHAPEVATEKQSAGVSPGLMNSNVPPRVQEINDTFARTGGIAPSAQGLSSTGMTGGQVTNTPVQTPYQQSTSGLLNIGQNGSEAYNRATKELADFRANLANKGAAINNTGADLNFKQGAGQVLQNAGLLKENALEAQVANALQGTEQQITAANNAGNLAKPQQVPYNNQVIDFTTGQRLGGGQAGQLPQEAQTTVNDYAQQVKDGKMTRADAESRLSPYGVAGTNALNAALGSDFNTNQANAQAEAGVKNTQLAGTTSALVDKTNQGLDTLSSAFDKLGSLQKTGSNWLTVPINALAEGTGIGKTSLDDYNRILAEVRASAQSVLSTAANLGVVTGGATANSLLPDNMSRQGLTTAIDTIKHLEEQTKSALANLNNASANGSTTSGGTVSAGGYNFKQVNGQWVPA